MKQAALQTSGPFRRSSRRACSFWVVCSLLITGCSPGSLFGNGKNEQVLQTPTYHPINRDCTQLDLGGSQFTSTNLREIVKCFNSKGALEPLQQLMDKMSDTQVDSFAQVLNQSLLHNPTLLFDYEQNFYAQKQDGELAASLQTFSQILDNPDLITSLFSLLDTSFNKNSKNQILTLLQSLGTKLDPVTVDGALSTSVTMNSSATYHSLLSNINSHRSASKYSLQDLTSKTIALLIEAKQPGFSFWSSVNQLVRNGDFFPGLDRVFGTDEASLRANTPSLATLFPILYANGGEIRNGLGAMYKDLENPISCLRGTMSAKNSVTEIFGEISQMPQGYAADYLRRDHLLRLEAIEPFCAFPESLKQNYSELQKLADSTAMSSVESIIRSSYLDHNAGAYPLINIIQGYLTDPKTAEITPFIEEASNRNIWPDLMLLIGETGDVNRDRVAGALNYYVSISDPLSDILIDAGADKTYAVASQIASYLSRDQEWFVPIAKGLRKSLNDGATHPHLELLQAILNQAPQNPAFFQTLFSLTQYPEFRATLALLSTMGTDGRLQEIMGDWVVLLHGTAVKGSHPIAAPPRGALANDSPLRANLQAADLAQAVAPARLQNPSCEQINLSIAPDQQLNTLTSCLASTGGFSDVQSLFNQLESAKTTQGQSEFQFLESWVSDLGSVLSNDSISSLADSWTQSVNDGQFHQIFSAASALVSQKVLEPLFSLANPFVSRGGSARKNIDSLMRFAVPIVRSPSFPGMLSVLDQASTIQLNPSSSYLNLGHDIARVQRWINNKECEKIPANNPSAEIQGRTRQIIRDYEEGSTSGGVVDDQPRFGWSMDEIKTLANPYLTKLGDPNQSNPSHLLKDGLLNFLRYFSLQPGEAPTVDKHFTPTDLERWFYDRTSDQKLITYYTIGEPSDQTPHVKLVSSLDRLELVLANADFDSLAPILDRLGVKVGINVGKYSMEQIGDSWGDEPEDLWPEEIKAKYAGSRPPTLAETVGNIKSLLSYLQTALGYPAIPSCSQKTDPNDPPSVQATELGDNATNCDPSDYAAARKAFDLPPLPGCIHLPDTKLMDVWNYKRRVYNIAQVVSSLDENLPGSGTSEQGGLKLLRDLFFQISYSTPTRYKSQTAGFNNNLSLVQFLVQSGVCRQLAFVMRRYSENDPALVSVFQTVVSAAGSSQGSGSSGISGLLDRLLAQDPSHTLLWNIAQSIFPYMGNPLQNGVLKSDPVSGQGSLYFDQSLINAGALIQRWNLADAGIESLNRMIDEHRDELNLRVGDILPALANQNVSWMVRGLEESPTSDGLTALQGVTESFLSNAENASNLLALAQNIDQDPVASGSLSTLENRWTEFQSSQAYQTLQLAPIGRQVLDFFEEKPSSDPRQPAAERALREYLAQRMESGDVDQLIQFMGTNPQQSELLLETTGSYLANGDLEGFFDFLHRALEQN
jgi:hypothetical protein